MQDTLYKLIFEARIQPGFKKRVVKKNLQELFKADKEKMKRLFSGKPVIVRKNLPVDKIRQYEKAMVVAGACCRVISVKDGLELPPLNPETLAETDPSFKTAAPMSGKGDTNGHSRLGRIRFNALFWVVALVEASAWLAPEYLLRFFGSILTIQQNTMLSAGLHALAGLILISMTILRLHDLNRTAWLWLFLLIPGLNLLFLFWLSFARGSKDQNAFGQVPSKAGHLAKLFGLWIPLLSVMALVGSIWLHYEELEQVAASLPGEILKLTEF